MRVKRSQQLLMDKSMKTPIKMLACLSLFTVPKGSANALPIAVDGPKIFLSESFDFSNQTSRSFENNEFGFGSSYAYFGDNFVYSGICDPSRFSPTSHECANSTGFNHSSGTHFVSTVELTPALAGERAKWGSAASMYRIFKFNIAERDPNLTYNIVATQNFDYKNPDIIGSRYKKHMTAMQLDLFCDDKNNISLARGSKIDNFVVLGQWLENQAVTIGTRITPEICPSNQFFLKFFVGYVQDISFKDLELMILQERPN
jgi:hypothetical protein